MWMTANTFNRFTIYVTRVIINQKTGHLDIKIMRMSPYSV